MAIFQLLGHCPLRGLCPTCAEYPFASSYQGGDGATVAWVPKSENDSQGLLMAEFYRLNRVMPDDAFYVNAYN